jgi:uncharacterized tellurite resistance protein B-like protein
MAANIDSLKDAGVSALFDLMSLPEDQRVGFYGCMLAIAAADGIFGRDELNLIFETINTDGLSEHARNTIWDYMIETPPLGDCLAPFSSSSGQVRCALMVYLIKIALADQVLDATEEEVLLHARLSLQISHTQLHAIEQLICEAGFTRPHLSDDNDTVVSLKYSVPLLTAVGIPATAVYFSSIIGGISVPEIFSSIANHSVSLTMALSAGTTMVAGTAAFLTGRLLAACNRRKRTTLAREQRQRAQFAVRNLQDAVGYLATKANRLATVRAPGESGKATSDVFTERLRVLQQMLARRQSSPSVIR